MIKNEGLVTVATRRLTEHSRRIIQLVDEYHSLLNDVSDPLANEDQVINALDELLYVVESINASVKEE